MKSSVLLFCFLLLPFSTQSCKTDMTTAKVEGGKVEGYTEGGINIFKGIPFAAPPVGILRWKAPQPVIAWDGKRSCKANPPSAMQPAPKPFFCWSGEFLIPPAPIDEDCLYLNVWTAAAERSEKRPVIVWIHGGGFGAGSGTVPLYDGYAMARKGVVFVTINYRLGVFGFLAHPELSAESPCNVSGNYGILDQIAALQWVKNNIRAFGGDPDNITIAGQSAGSFSVNVLMASPLAKGLFHKAIGESGAMFGNKSPLSRSLKQAETAGVDYAIRVGAASLNDLRNKTAEELLKTPAMTGLIVDSVVVMNVRDIFSEGEQNDVPLITGWNADDGVSFARPQKAVDYVSDVKNKYGDIAGSFLSAFPGGNDLQAQQSQHDISRMFFAWNNYSWAKMQSRTGKKKAYLYLFSRVPPGEPDYGAFHSAEFGYALDNLTQWDRPFTETDYKLADIISSYWVRFAESGDPNVIGLPRWPAFDDYSQQMIEFGDEVRTISLPAPEQFEIFDVINDMKKAD